MSTYVELFRDRPVCTEGQSDIVLAVCALVDATRENTAELRAFRITAAQIAGGHDTIVDRPGVTQYPWCDVCNCPHHPENDHCILRGGKGVEAIYLAGLAADPPQTQAENEAEAQAAISEFFKEQTR